MWATCKNWFVERSRAWLRRPIRAIIQTVVLAWIFTIIAWALWAYFGAPFAKPILVDIFAAWTGELAFFTVVGSVAAVVGLREPAHEPLMQRIRILYGTQDVPDFVLGYNAGELGKLAAYSPEADRSIVIEEYNAGYGAYKARIRTHYRIRNILRDVSYNDVIDVSFFPDSFANPPPEIGRLRSVHIGNEEKLAGPAPIGARGYKATFPISIQPNQTSGVVVEYTMWFKAGEEQSLIPRRLVEIFSMEIVSEIEGTIRVDKGAAGGVVDLAYRVPHRFPEVRAASPRESLFSFKLLPPA